MDRPHFKMVTLGAHEHENGLFNLIKKQFYHPEKALNKSVLISIDTLYLHYLSYDTKSGNRIETFKKK